MEGSSSTEEPLNRKGLDWELDMEEMLNLVDDFKRKEKQRRERKRERKMELRKLRSEQNELEKRLADLRLELCQAHKEIGRKHDEIFKLKGKVEELTTAEDKKDKATDKVKEQPLPASKRDPGNSDEYSWRKDAITIFPEEIWEMIFGYLTSTDDLWRLCNTCLLFEDILYKWRTRYLLEQALPYLYPLLPGGKLLECRLVCKSWSEGIDNLLDNHPSLRPYPSDDNDKTKKRDARRLDWVNPMLEKGLGKRDIYFFGEPPTDKRWPLWLNRVGLNPFLGRYVVIVIGSHQGDTDMLVAFQEAEFFLRTLGKHIWYLSLHIRADPTEKVTEQVLKLITFLPHFVPNLRKLRIDAPEYDTTGDYPITPERCGCIAPFPMLETLEGDFIARFGRNPILEVLIRKYHRQLRKLRIFPGAWRRVSHLDWSNLTELHLFVQVEQNFESLHWVRMPQLKKLDFYFSGTVQFGFEAVMEAINALASGSKLEAVKIFGKLGRLRYWNLLQSGRAYAPPSVKTLEVDFLRLQQDQSFLIFVLRCFPFVENLHILAAKSNECGWNLTCSQEQQSPQPVKFTPFSEVKLWPSESVKVGALTQLKVGREMEKDLLEVNKYVFEGDMYKSHIWELMPHLKVMTFQWDVYTREGYEEYWKKRGNPRI